MRTFFSLFLQMAITICFFTYSWGQVKNPINVPLSSKERAEFEKYILQLSKFDQRNNPKVHENTPPSYTAYWIAGGITAALITILLIASYDREKHAWSLQKIIEGLQKLKILKKPLDDFDWNQIT